MRHRILSAALLATLMIPASVQAQSAKPAYCKTEGEFQTRIHTFQQCIAEAARDSEAGEDDLNVVADKSVESCSSHKDPLIDFISLCSGDNGVEMIARQVDVFHLWGVEAAAAFREDRMVHRQKST